jgi:hypothetical protein
MDWLSLIPTTLLQLGGLLLVLGIALVFLDVPGKGVPWDKVGAWFCLLGGFGVGGAAAGTVGSALGSLADGVMTTSQKFATQAIGVGITVAVFAVFGLWAWSRVKGKGLATKSKLKSFVLAGVLALAGTVLAAVPDLYGGLGGIYSDMTTSLVISIRTS